ncbi:hypothetical protein SPBRAN_1623 [uncultured Candidatus Thioglobus sp.]|nr:hypothetical protein SPBRAN_1623 [uncultured Candidatus Thioglobus sp.]
MNISNAKILSDDNSLKEFHLHLAFIRGKFKNGIKPTGNK